MGKKSAQLIEKWRATVDEDGQYLFASRYDVGAYGTLP
jgi:hypothetical protein